MFPRIFSKAGATGHVFIVSNGKVIDKGMAYSWFVGPFSTVAVVPTTPRVIDIGIEALTADKQPITVTGDIKVSFSVGVAIAKFDFAVNIANGSYVNPWDKILKALVIEQALAPVFEKAKSLKVSEVVTANNAFEDAISGAVKNCEAFKSYGIIFNSCSVAKIEPDDEDVAESLGAKERFEMTAIAFTAAHERRMEGVRNERKIKTHEAKTAQTLEQERKALLELQGENKKQEAQADAEATKIRLAPLKDVASGKLLGAALMEAAKGGRLGSFNVTSEFLAAAGK